MASSWLPRSYFLLLCVVFAMGSCSAQAHDAAAPNKAASPGQDYPLRLSKDVISLGIREARNTLAFIRTFSSLKALLGISPAAERVACIQRLMGDVEEAEQWLVKVKHQGPGTVKRGSTFLSDRVRRTLSLSCDGLLGNLDQSLAFMLQARLTAAAIIVDSAFYSVDAFVRPATLPSTGN